MRVARPVILIVLLIAAGIGIYFAVRTTPQPEPLRKEQEVTFAKFIPVSPRRPAPEAQFSTLDGKTQRLSDFHGHWLLVNLWATWCAPCLKEMPSLDRLQAKLGGTLDIIAISEDRKGKDAVASYIATLGIKALPVALDPPGQVASAFQVPGLPTTLLIDPDGRIVAQLEGAADWDHEKTLAALKDLMSKPEG